MLTFAATRTHTTMTTISLKTIEQNDNVGMFSICFDGSEESEFEKFLIEFKDNATYNKDFNVILMALSKIIDKGALERFFRNEGRMNDNVKALAIDSRRLRLSTVYAYLTKFSYLATAASRIHAHIKRMRN